MSYFALAAGSGYFRSAATLDSTLKTEAELFATTRINAAFARWDRSDWSGAAIPVEIGQIAELLAAGKYLEKAFATGNPKVDPDSLSQRLQRQGESLIDSVLGAGGPTDPENDALRLLPIYQQPTQRSMRVLPG